MAFPTRMESVTFVIPAWRADAFLMPAIESALRQTHPFTQVVLVLDGPVAIGQDDLPAGNVQIVRLPDRRGPAAARNAGARAADGSVIAVLDADDLARPDRASAQVSLLARAGAAVDLVAGSMIVIDAQGRVQGRRGGRGLSPEATRRTLPLRNPLVHSSVMARRATLESLGGYDEGLERFIDYDLYLRAALAGHGIARSATVVGSVRAHEGQLSAQRVSDHVLRHVSGLRSDLGTQVGLGRAFTRAGNAVWRLQNRRGHRRPRPGVATGAS